MTTNKFYLFLSKGKAFLAAAMLMLVMGSCLHGNGDNEVKPYGFVAIYQASPDADGMDVRVDETKVNNFAFEYGDYSGYMNLTTGKRIIKFSPSNSTSTLIEKAVDVETGKAYSVFVINRANNLQTLLVQDSSSVTPGGDEAMVRFIHLSPDAEAVDASLTSTSGTTTLLSPNNTFRYASAFKKVSASTYKLHLTSTNGSGALDFTKENLSLRPGLFYTIVFRGFVTPPAGNTNGLSVDLY